MNDTYYDERPDEEYGPEPEPYQHMRSRRRWDDVKYRARRAATRVVVLFGVAGIVWLGVIGYRWYRRRPIAGPAPVVHMPRTSAVSIPWHLVRQDLASAMETARARAEQHARKELENWTAAMNDRATEQFIPEHLAFWHQQGLELRAAYHTAARWFTDAPTAEEVLLKSIEHEFETIVVRPPLAQARFERLVGECVNMYLLDVGKAVQEIPARYRVPQAAWEHHVEQLAQLVSATGRTRRTPLTLKAAATGSVVAGGMLAKPAVHVVKALVRRLTGRSAARVGGKVAAKIGGKIAGPLVLAGVIAWEVIDHRMSVKKYRPLMEQAVADYLQELQAALLREIQGTLANVEADILAVLPAANEGGRHVLAQDPQ